MLVDSHCHLDYPDFAEEGVEEIIARAGKVGVGYFMTICTHISQFDRVRTVSESAPNIFCALGTHPHHAAEAEEADIPKEKIIAMAQHEKVVAIGETGLDYYYDHAPRDIQQKVFAKHIEVSVETGLPLVIHTRDAEEDTIRLLRDVGQGRAKGVMHCFTGTQWLADEALKLGFYISFSGILTFKKSEDLRTVAGSVPMDRLLVETDSPYLAPMPYRGKRNEPAYVIHTAETLADVKGVPAAEIAKQTADNYFTLFSKAKRS